MKSFAVFAVVALGLVVGCASPAAEAESSSNQDLVSDVSSMRQNPDGTFDVTCNDGTSEHSATLDSIHADTVCKPHPRLACSFVYQSSQTNPDGSVPTFAIDSMIQAFEASSSVIKKFGTDAHPYTAQVQVNPASSSSSYVDISISKGASVLTSSEAQVSTASLAMPGTDRIVAGDLRAPVAAFDYEGRSYDRLEVACELLPVAH